MELTSKALNLQSKWQIFIQRVRIIKHKTKCKIKKSTVKDKYSNKTEQFKVKLSK